MTTVSPAARHTEALATLRKMVLCLPLLPPPGEQVAGPFVKAAIRTLGSHYPLWHHDYWWCQGCSHSRWDECFEVKSILDAIAEAQR